MEKLQFIYQTFTLEISTPMKKKLLEIIDEIKPDYIFLTGDYVKWGKGYDTALDFLSRLKAKAGIYAVMGDYDYSNSRKSCLFCHEKGAGEFTKDHNIKFLRNNKVDISLTDGKVSFAGIDREYEDGEKNIANSEIVLSHSPLFIDEFETENEVLILSGDTHGGQIPLPGVIWKLLCYEKNAKYSQGLFKKGNTSMYVSRGIGTSHIPFRLFRRPEVVVVHF